MKARLARRIRATLALPLLRPIGIHVRRLILQTGDDAVLVALSLGALVPLEVEVRDGY